MAALAHRGRLGDLAARQEQRHARVAEAERRQPRQLAGEIERELARRDDGVDDGDRLEVAIVELRVGVRGERLDERLELLGGRR